jgi:hypothetical protein
LFLTSSSSSLRRKQQNLEMCIAHCSSREITAAAFHDGAPQKKDKLSQTWTTTSDEPINKKSRVWRRGPEELAHNGRDA